MLSLHKLITWGVFYIDGRLMTTNSSFFFFFFQVAPTNLLFRSRSVKYWYFFMVSPVWNSAWHDLNCLLMLRPIGLHWHSRPLPSLLDCIEYNELKAQVHVWTQDLPTMGLSKVGHQPQCSECLWSYVSFFLVVVVLGVELRASCLHYHLRCPSQSFWF
jgi:hypothetical protein